MLIVTFAVLVYSFNNQMNTLLWNSSNTTDNVVLQCLCLSGGGGKSHTLPIRVCAAQRGRDFEAVDFERGIHFRGVF